MSSELLPSKDVCEELRIDRSTLSRWVSLGRIKPVTKLPGLRGAFLFSRDEIDRIAAAEQVSA